MGDASYKFLYVDVGTAGGASDAGVYSPSMLQNAIASITLSLQCPTPLPKNPEFEINYHVVGRAVPRKFSWGVVKLVCADKNGHGR